MTGVDVAAIRSRCERAAKGNRNADYLVEAMCGEVAQWHVYETRDAGQSRGGAE